MSVPTITTTLAFLAAVAFVLLSRRGTSWLLHVQFARAFRAGRKFYESYPHIAKDIAYGDLPRQALDVYWPPDLKPGDRLPVLLFVHGGSWSWGDKELYPLAGKRFVEQGYVVVVINYRLYPDATFPAFVEDAATAIAWTVQHIAGYSGDPERLFVAGHSAGGHILSLVALDDRYLARHGLRRDALRGVVVISAPTDLGALIEHLRAHPRDGYADGLSAIMGGPAALPLADPIRHARADAPPILLIHGARDRLVPIDIARNFVSALKAAGATAELLEYPRDDHFSIVLDGARGKADRPPRLLVDARAFTQRVARSRSAA